MPDGGDGELRAEGLVAEQQAVVDGGEQQVEGHLDVEVRAELVWPLPRVPAVSRSVSDPYDW